VRAAFAVLLGLTTVLTGSNTWAAEPLLNPLDGMVRVIQGYNGGTHQGRSQFALDLVLAGGGTTGAAVRSPIDGRVVWAMAPGAGNGCIGIALRDGNYSVALCHVLFDQVFRRGEAIARGQVLGTVGAAGTLGNNGTPHVHVELHRGGAARDPIPFETLGGLSGSEAPAPALRAVAPSPAPKPAAAPAPAPKPVAEPVAASAPRPVAEAVRMAIVEGTASCLNVRESPVLDAAIRTCIAEGSEVSLGTERNEGWRQIANKGWASAEFLRLTRAIVSGTSSCLNVRDGPSTSAAVVSCLAEGTPIKLAEGPHTADGLGWFKLASDAGGWVASAFLG
jgi:hypothetical protein